MAVLPTRLLEIEFDAGVWTDVFADVVDIGTRRGRNRESGAYETGNGIVTLRNAGRKYDPENTAGPYYGKLRPNRRIRFRATYNAVTYPVIVGYIDRITQNYGGPNDATATIEFSDLFKLLNRAELPTSVYVAEVLADSPAHWWRLGDPAGATVAADRLGTAPGTAYGGLTFGTAGAIVRDTDTAATFDGVDDWVDAGTAPLITAFPYTVEAWIKIPFRTTLGDQFFFTQATDGAVGGNGQPAGYVNGVDTPANAGRVVWDGCTSGATHVDDDAWHHVVLTAPSGAAGAQTLYVDGVAVGTGTATTPGQGTPRVAIGAPAEAPFVAVNKDPFNGSIDEVATYATALSAARVAAHNTAGRTPWRTDLPGTRLGRILDLAAVPAADRNLDAGTTSLQSTSLDTAALGYAQKVEETELGALFVTRDGKVRFVGREALVTGAYLTSQATFVDDDSGAGIPYRTGGTSDVDEGILVTRATVSREGSVAVTYYDAAAKAEFGWLDDTHDGLLHDSDAYSAAYAQWVVNTHKTPSPRVGVLTFTPPKDPANMYPALLALELADRTTYKRKPQNTGAVITTAMRVESIAHETGAGYWRMRLQLSPFNLGESGWPVGVWDTGLWDQSVWGI